jgi:hypothetical protein
MSAGVQQLILHGPERAGLPLPRPVSSSTHHRAVTQDCAGACAFRGKTTGYGRTINRGLVGVFTAEADTRRRAVALI